MADGSKLMQNKDLLKDFSELRICRGSFGLRAARVHIIMMDYDTLHYIGGVRSKKLSVFARRIYISTVMQLN